MAPRAQGTGDRSRAEATYAAELTRLHPTLEDWKTLRDFVEKIAEAIYISMPDGRILDGNPALLRIFGAESLSQLRQLDPDQLFVDAARHEEERRQIQKHGSVRNFEIEIRRLDGTTRTVSDTVYAHRDTEGQIVAYHGILVDITERKLAERALRQSEEKYRAIFENVQDVFYQTAVDGRVLEISPSAKRYLGFSRAELIGRSIEELYSRPAARDDLRQRLLADGEVTDYEVELKSRDGTVITVSVNAHVIRDDAGEAVGFEGSLRDISERKQLQQKLEELSVRDPLTGAYNRRYLEKIRSRLERPTSSWGCLVLDLDNFKAVNDTYGHEEGDRVLQGVAHFVRRHGRAEDVLLRLGGDEFAMIVQASSEEELESIADRLLDVAPYESPAAFSLGVAFRRPSDTIEQVVARADRAMYAAKGRGVERPARR